MLGHCNDFTIMRRLEVSFTNVKTLMKKDEMRGAHTVHEGNEKCIKNFIFNTLIFGEEHKFWSSSLSNFSSLLLHFFTSYILLSILFFEYVLFPWSTYTNNIK
jgi:hypothetical protein